MPRPVRTKPVSGAQVRAYAGKAEEYADAAASEIDGTKVEKELRRLLPLETKAEYEPDDVAPGVATTALERAQRCVAVARTVAAGST